MRITEDHIKSIIFGVAVGDALGVPFEFSSRERLVEKPLTDHIFLPLCAILTKNRV